jgi:hypothetical protein
MSLVPVLRRSRDRRIRRQRFRSSFIRPPQSPPFKYLLTTREFCTAWGISDHTARLWREQWLRTGYHNSPQPRNYSDNSVKEYRYYFDEVCGIPEGTWLERFKAQQKLDFAVPTNKLHKEAIA